LYIIQKRKPQDKSAAGLFVFITVVVTMNAANSLQEGTGDIQPPYTVLCSSQS